MGRLERATERLEKQKQGVRARKREMRRAIIRELKKEAKGESC